MKGAMPKGSAFPELKGLMKTGEPVCVTFEGSGVQQVCRSPEYPRSDLLFCEMVQRARAGEVFLSSGQGCSPGDYVLGVSESSPSAYYLKSGRYASPAAAEKAALALPRLSKKFSIIRIEPLSRNSGKFDVLILFLTPERAMRVVQAYAYASGDRVVFDTFGAASICGDCTVLALQRGMGLSFGCKGSRKHSGYGDSEVPLGLAFEKLEEIEKGLKNIPETRA